MNISSIVIQCVPQYVEGLVEEIKKGDLGEYQIHDEKGRIIVILEEEGSEQEVGKIKRIQALPHVLSAEMVFAYSEDELESERDKLDQTNTVPDWLNNPDASFKDIRYNGDLKGKL